MKVTKKSIENLKPYKKGELSKELAKEMQLKSAEKRKENNLKKLIFKEAIQELMTQEDFDEIILNQIKRAKESDYSYSVLRDTLGQKPGDELKLSGDEDKPFKVNINVVR